MNKKKLLEQLLGELESTYQVAFNAAQRAHETATADENIAENKYDTLALEAAYLAQGQSVRVEQCDADIQAFKALCCDSTRERVSLASIVVLLDQHDVKKYLFIGPTAGGVKVCVDGSEVVVVTLASPLGKIVNGKQVGDEICLKVGDRSYDYEIVALF